MSDSTIDDETDSLFDESDGDIDDTDDIKILSNVGPLQLYQPGSITGTPSAYSHHQQLRTPSACDSSIIHIGCSHMQVVRSP